jgi:phage baseplate assembly protein W
MSQFLGKGWSFPIRPRAGALRYAQGDDKVRQSIALILETEPGERLMRPEFGCGLRRYLMKPNTSATRALIAHDVEQALRRFEPRIALKSVRVEPGDDPALVVIDIAYAHVRDGSPGNLVYPFYLE